MAHGSLGAWDIWVDAWQVRERPEARGCDFVAEPGCIVYVSNAVFVE